MGRVVSTDDNSKKKIRYFSEGHQKDHNNQTSKMHPETAPCCPLDSVCSTHLPTSSLRHPWLGRSEQNLAAWSIEEDSGRQPSRGLERSTFELGPLSEYSRAEEGLAIYLCFLVGFIAIKSGEMKTKADWRRVHGYPLGLGHRNYPAQCTLPLKPE